MLKFDSPLSLFFSNEIDNYNNSVAALRKEIQKTLDGRVTAEILTAISNEEFPAAWCAHFGYFKNRQVSKFISVLTDQVDFYERWLKNGLTGNQVGLSFVRNVRGLMHSYLCEIAVQRQQSIELSTFRFAITDGIQEHEPGLILSDAWLVGAHWNCRDQKIIEAGEKGSPFMMLQQIICIPKWTEAPTGTKEGEYLCPFYVTLPNGEFRPTNTEKFVDGRSENFICYVPLESEIPVQRLTLDSVAIVCQLPELFTG
jgi:hypothetical protein